MERRRLAIRNRQTKQNDCRFVDLSPSPFALNLQQRAGKLR
jgi:hypothetical protein